MSKYYLYLLTVLLVSLSSLTSFAQDHTWQTLIFTDENIIRVTENGLADPIILPEAARGFQTNNTPIPVALSPDERYFVYVVEDNQGDQGFTSTLFVADLEDDTCCTEIPSPDGQAWEVINLGKFSPDNGSLAINFLNAYFAETDALLVTLDLETGDYTSIMEPWEVFNTGAVFFIDWTDEGIEVVPTCFPCGASADGYTTLWNPETDEITSEHGYNVSLTGSRLANGEIIEAVQDENYPIGEADVMVGPFNVIQYFTDDDLEAREMIYFDPENLNLIDIEWVIDGDAYLIQDQFGQGATLVWRDGNTQKLDFDQQQFFFAGTPDGWLMTDAGMQTLYQYQWVDGELQMTELGTYEYMRILQTPVLGEDAMEAITPQIEDV